MVATEVLRIDPGDPSPHAIRRAAAIIRHGGLVAFPTETVYGLGADALTEPAVLKIFKAKGRPTDNPLIVHVDGKRMLSAVAETLSNKSEKLIDRLWPGPLTLVLERRAGVSPAVSAGLSTVAVRMPDSKAALALISAAGTPIAAPSANTSGKPSPTSAQHVFEDLNGKIDLVLDGGNTCIGIESTVVDMTCDPPVVLRQGWITREQLSRLIGEVREAGSQTELRRSPGTRYRHYSPNARVVLIEDGSPEFIRRKIEELSGAGPVGFVGHVDPDAGPSVQEKVVLKNDAADYARCIYGALRQLDASGMKAIVVQGVGGSGEADAVMDRLRRAASEILCENAPKT